MVTTWHAPAERADEETLQATRQAFLANPLAVTLLEAIPDMAIVLNKERQIVAVNGRFRETLNIKNGDSLQGLRPGEAVDCLYACDGPGGCGTGRFCIYCGAVDAILESLDEHGSTARDCRILTRREADGGALELEVQATFFTANEHELLIVILRDISAENRRHLLERIFFHDVLNTVSSIRMISQLMQTVEEGSETMNELKQMLARLSRQASDEITAQQQLLSAERGDLKVVPVETPIADLLRDLRTYHCTGDPDQLERVVLNIPPDVQVVTDPVILRRVLGNLVKNALEAAPASGTIFITAEARDGEIAFHINNPGVIPEEVQRQIFQRSFSTKGGHGRGIGTFSVKLLTERYLNGQVTFVSKEPEGTTFTVSLPVTLAK